MSDIAIIDLEASGLHFDSYPIEVAARVNGATKSWLIRPEPNWTYWCDTAESLHGISRSELTSSGLPPSQVASELNAFLSQTDGLIYSDAAQWDSDWINTLYHAANEPQLFHILSLYDLLEPDQHTKFDDTKTQLADSGRYRQHRAAEDVELIYWSYINTKLEQE
ncbi:hypothetical protein [Agaribacterium sp. ZY112]|uniref:hypothetical protein n=1 Tax=Agaribacterium sp. ZY112 TaxID=3233574 RepID=UPI0035254376